ncbi:MAG TPA: hypothetical protein VIX85_01030 [Acidimicrobiales bacterium]
MVPNRAIKHTPTAEGMLADIEAILAFGIRQPGHSGDRHAEVWAARRFAEVGPYDVALEPVEVQMWEYGEATLDVWSPDDPAGPPHHFEGFALPYTEWCRDLDRDLVAFDPLTAKDRIVVEPLTLTELPQSLLREWATFVFDPEG